MIELTDSQNEALSLLTEEMRDGNPFVTLGGYAGTGKSTLIPFIAEAMGNLNQTAFCTYTGKAAQVLREKLESVGMLSQCAYVGTIHGLIYQLIEEKKDGTMRWQRRHSLSVDGGRDNFDWDNIDWDDANSKDLGGWILRKEDVGNDSGIKRIFIDEVSMVGRRTLDDLRSYGIPLVAVGDPAQLPPIQDESVLVDPDVVLTEVHRQAKDNPIIQLATSIRETGVLPANTPRISYDQAGEILEKEQAQDPLDLAILTRSNRARVFFNNKIYGSEPKPGNVVICLKNEWPQGLYNGLRGVIQEAPPWMNKKNPLHPMYITFPDSHYTKYVPKVNMRQFGQEKKLNQMVMEEKYKTSSVGSLFDFGTAMTVHKSQGSGFKTVLISPEEWSWNKREKEDWAKWLYTAVTRATTNLHFLPNW